MLDDPVVRGVVSAYLEAVDAATPGLVEGLYLVGSAALGDFHPVLATSTTWPSPRPHRVGPRLPRWPRHTGGFATPGPRPYFDGAYVIWAELAGDPAVAIRGPGSHEGRVGVRLGERGQVHWHTLARYGVTCRGPTPAELEVLADPHGLAAWTNDNLDRHWRRLLERGSRAWSRSGLSAMTRYAAVWGVTGVSRLHYTLATGDITSKAGAAYYAMATFPERVAPPDRGEHPDPQRPTGAIPVSDSRSTPMGPARVRPHGHRRRSPPIRRTTMTHNRSMATALTTMPSSATDTCPWIQFLPDDAQAEFMGEIIETALACAETGDFQPLVVMLHAWRSTAAIYADPHLSRLFKEPLAGDFGPVEVPDCEIASHPRSTE